MIEAMIRLGHFLRETGIDPATVHVTIEFNDDKSRTAALNNIREIGSFPSAVAGIRTRFEVCDRVGNRVAAPCECGC